MRSHQTAEQVSLSPSDFDDAIEAFRQALHAYLGGDLKPSLELFSLRDDVTIANPVGPPVRGPAEIAKAAAEAAAQFSDGSICGFEEVSRYSTPDLGYVVQIERGQARFADSGNISPYSLRVTMIFRREGDTWKVAHRHADPITTPRPLTTVIETGTQGTRAALWWATSSLACCAAGWAADLILALPIESGPAVDQVVEPEVARAGSKPSGAEASGVNEESALSPSFGFGSAARRSSGSTSHTATSESRSPKAP